MAVKIRILGRSSFPGVQWCEPIGWEPTNVIEGSTLVDGVWWDDHEPAAGLGFLGEGRPEEVLDVDTDRLRVVASGEFRILGPVLLH